MSTSFSSWLRDQRKAQGLTQAELGNRLGVHQVTVSSWETEKTTPGDEEMARLRALFGEMPVSSATEATAPAPSAPPARRPTTEELRQQASAKNKRRSSTETTDYRHEGEKRTNIPPAKIAAEGQVPRVAKARYAYNPHLPPVLRFDPSGETDRVRDRVEEILAKAQQGALSADEAGEVRAALSTYDPWLEWAGKREEHERGFFEVDPVALHIHERVSAQAIVRAAMREDIQRGLFADPEFPYQKEVQFYRHDVDWTNRLILGDSLQVMSSLARREGLAGKVKMIYMDPPYGIKFSSNFQPTVAQRKVGISDSDLSREPETVKAYRDTWTLGLHSYLSYLRQRFIVARDLLAMGGSIFVQISDDNVHFVRAVLDSVFGVANCVATIAWKKGAPQSSTIKNSFNYLLWYARDVESLRVRKLYRERAPNEGSTEDPRKLALWAEFSSSERRTLTTDEKRTPSLLPDDARIFRVQEVETSGGRNIFPLQICGETFLPRQGRAWRGTSKEMERLERAGRLTKATRGLGYRFFVVEDSPVVEFTNLWEDTAGNIPNMVYAVQTNHKLVERCVLLATEPGDLVLDPTCGSGTTAFVAEQWGRRWVTIDTSRVALAVARQRLLTSKYEHYRTCEGGDYSNPGAGLVYKAVPHITLKSIAQNSNLDPIFAKHEPILAARLAACNAALAHIPDTLRKRLTEKLRDQERSEGKRAVTDADRRRWLLPPENRDRSKKARKKATVDLDASMWYDWEVPFDTDPEWPRELQEAVTAYGEAWRAKMDEVNACIAANADPKMLVDQPEVVKGVLRVSGPFTVEGVMPDELNLGEEGLFGGAPSVIGSNGGSEEVSEDEISAEAETELRNASAYLGQMVRYLRNDGITFPDNQHRNFVRLESLFDSSESGDGLVHAEGLWDGEDEGEPNHVGIAIGPQYGPITAQQVEDTIRASRRYDELVLAGFSFDAAASAVIQESEHPRLRIHQAYIRPDINPGMDGLLKETPNSQLFTVFGQPEIEVRREEDEWVCELIGVDVYDPLTSEVRATGASKVAAWFLDQDYDGRCFCITQAFFPDQDAWSKIAKALGSAADPEAFAAFEGTESLPFRPGKHGRIAVKVIDPRGNEVMAIKSLELSSGIEESENGAHNAAGPGAPPGLAPHAGGPRTCPE